MTDTPVYARLNDMAADALHHADKYERDCAAVLQKIATALFHHREVVQERCGEGFHHDATLAAIDALERHTGLVFQLPAAPESVSAVAPTEGHASCFGWAR